MKFKVIDRWADVSIERVSFELRQMLRSFSPLFRGLRTATAPDRRFRCSMFGVFGQNTKTNEMIQNDCYFIYKHDGYFDVLERIPEEGEVLEDCFGLGDPRLHEQKYREIVEVDFQQSLFVE